MLNMWLVRSPQKGMTENRRWVGWELSLACKLSVPCPTEQISLSLCPREKSKIGLRAPTTLTLPKSSMRRRRRKEKEKWQLLRFLGLLFTSN